MPRFITVTANPAIDRNYVVPHLMLGQVHRADRIACTPGGKGINVSRLLKTLGADVVATGLVGGVNGDLLKAGLTDEGIAHEFVDVGSAETRLAIVLLDPESGAQTVINEAGPIVDSQAQERLAAMLCRLVREGDVVVFSGSLPPGMSSLDYGELISAAKARGAVTLLDSSGSALVAGVAANPSIVKVNRNEALALSVSIDIWRIDAPRAASDLLERGGIGCVALTAGADGAVIAGRMGAYSVSMPALSVVSAVGSGDAFAAGLVYGLARDPDDLESALRLAAACGGANALNEGAGYCTREQIEAVSGKIEIVRVG